MGLLQKEVQIEKPKPNKIINIKRKYLNGYDAMRKT